MKILFIHNNFPGQYRRLVPYITKNTDFKCAVATLETNKQKFPYTRINYKPHREPTKDVHPAVAYTESSAIMGQAAYKALIDVRNKGSAPDIVLAHSGWGASMFIKDIFPNAKFLAYHEWFYHSYGTDGDFLNKRKSDPNYEMTIRLKNTPILQDLSSMDWGQSPTQFQINKIPKVFHSKMSVLHDGVDTSFFYPKDGVRVELPDGKFLSAEDEVITYISRGMEQQRGFPQFMESISILMKERPNLHVMVIGDDRIAYGAKRKDGKGMKSEMLEKFDYDKDRLHFLGLVPIQGMLAALRISSLHVYFTVPFVLSWSMMEALATGALVMGSKTQPVEEMITHNENGLLVDFFDIDAQVACMNDALDNQDKYIPLRQAARQLILDHYSVDDLLPKYQKLIENVANGQQVSV